MATRKPRRRPPVKAKKRNPQRKLAQRKKKGGNGWGKLALGLLIPGA